MIGTDYAMGRSILTGLAQGPRRPVDWVFHQHYPTLEGWKALAAIKPNGVIAQLGNKNLADALHAWGKPVVSVSSIRDERRFPGIRLDDRKIGKIAAEHFMERGFRRYAFLGQKGRHNSEMRLAGFQHAIAERGFQAEVFRVKGEPSQLRTEEWTPLDDLLTPWLRELGRPVGLFCHNSYYARDVARTLRNLGIRSPEDIAILSTDDDPVLCGLESPPISSILQPGERMGQEAAGLLELMLGGGVLDLEPMLLPPVGIITRQSTEVLASDDPIVNEALGFITRNAGRAISVPEVAKHTGCDRRNLERRFLAALDIGPGKSIVEAHLRRAEQILRTSDLALSEVAELSGFSNSSRLSEAFRRVRGTTPSAYRKGS